MLKVLATDEQGRPMIIRKRRSDNGHLHLRGGARMKAVVLATALVYGRATIMPNVPLILKVSEADTYREDIVAALMANRFSREAAERFPQMTIYLHPGLSEREIAQAVERKYMFKFYPKNPEHGTTGANSGHSVASLEGVSQQIEWIAKYGGTLLLHGEDATPGEDIFDLEKLFLERQLSKLCERYPTGLKIVAEHITTEDLADFVIRAPDNVAATITPHHLLYNRGALFAGGLRVHRHQMPIYKRKRHQAALIKAATSGNPKFSAGDDSAPHPRHGPPGKAKETDCGCAGTYCAPVSEPTYVEVFDNANALLAVEAFMSEHWANFHQLPLNEDEVTLARVDSGYQVPLECDFGDGDTVVPLRAGEMLPWRVIGGDHPR